MNPGALLQLINQRNETSFTLINRYATGEQGAYALADIEDNRFVLKWRPEPTRIDRYQTAAQVTDLLREVGYPAPQYTLVGVLGGVSYSIQRALPGTPDQMTTIDLAPRLVKLNRL